MFCICKEFNTGLNGSTIIASCWARAEIVSYRKINQNWNIESGTSLYNMLPVFQLQLCCPNLTWRWKLNISWKSIIKKLNQFLINQLESTTTCIFLSAIFILYLIFYITFKLISTLISLFTWLKGTTQFNGQIKKQGKRFFIYTIIHAHRGHWLSLHKMRFFPLKSQMKHFTFFLFRVCTYIF